MMNSLFVNCYKNTAALQSDRHFIPNNYLPVTVICESLRTVTDNQDRPILNKWQLVLFGHFPFVTAVTVEYNFDCRLFSLLFESKKIYMENSELTCSGVTCNKCYSLPDCSGTLELFPFVHILTRFYSLQLKYYKSKYSTRPNIKYLYICIV